MDNQLVTKGWHLSEDGIKDCEKATGKESPSLNDIISVALISDIRHIARKKLPENINGGQVEALDGPIVLQIQKVRNLSAPVSNQGSQAAPRMLKLNLTDGCTHCVAIEFDHVSSFNSSTIPGVKICLVGPGVKIAKGCILLTSDNVKLLGGEVEVLKAKWEASRQVDATERFGKQKDDPPPLFREYDGTSRPRSRKAQNSSKGAKDMVYSKDTSQQKRTDISNQPNDESKQRSKVRERNEISKKNDDENSSEKRYTGKNERCELGRNEKKENMNRGNESHDPRWNSDKVESYPTKTERNNDSFKRNVEGKMYDKNKKNNDTNWYEREKSVSKAKENQQSRYDQKNEDGDRNSFRRDNVVQKTQAESRKSNIDDQKDKDKDSRPSSSSHLHLEDDKKSVEQKGHYNEKSRGHSTPQLEEQPKKKSCDTVKETNSQERHRSTGNLSERGAPNPGRKTSNPERKVSSNKNGRYSNDSRYDNWNDDQNYSRGKNTKDSNVTRNERSRNDRGSDGGRNYYDGDREKKNTKNDRGEDKKKRNDDKGRNDAARNSVTRKDIGRKDIGQSETGRNETGRNETGRNETGRNETGRNETGRNETGRNETGRNETGRNDAGKNDVGRNNFGRNEARRNDTGRNDRRNDNGQNDYGRNDYGRNDYGRSDNRRNCSGRNDYERSDNVRNDTRRNDVERKGTGRNEVSRNSAGRGRRNDLSSSDKRNLGGSYDVGEYDKSKDGGRRGAPNKNYGSRYEYDANENEMDDCFRYEPDKMVTAINGGNNELKGNRGSVKGSGDERENYNSMSNKDRKEKEPSNRSMKDKDFVHNGKEEFERDKRETKPKYYDHTTQSWYYDQGKKEQSRHGDQVTVTFKNNHYEETSRSNNNPKRNESREANQLQEKKRNDNRSQEGVPQKRTKDFISRSDKRKNEDFDYRYKDQSKPYDEEPKSGRRSSNDSHISRGSRSSRGSNNDIQSTHGQLQIDEKWSKSEELIKPTQTSAAQSSPGRRIHLAELFGKSHSVSGDKEAHESRSVDGVTISLANLALPDQRGACQAESHPGKITSKEIMERSLEQVQYNQPSQQDLLYMQYSTMNQMSQLGQQQIPYYPQPMTMTGLQGPSTSQYYGYSNEHLSFPNTFSNSMDTYRYNQLPSQQGTLQQPMAQHLHNHNDVPMYANNPYYYHIPNPSPQTLEQYQ